MALYRCGMGGAKTAHGTVTNVNYNTEYTIDTGLSAVNYFCAYQSPTGGYTGLIYDASEPSYYFQGYYRSGTGQAYGRKSINAGGGSVMPVITSVSGGTVKLKTGTSNLDVNKQNIVWFAQ